jgi:hypothetical protein
LQQENNIELFHTKLTSYGILYILVGGRKNISMSKLKLIKSTKLESIYFTVTTSSFDFKGMVNNFPDEYISSMPSHVEIEDISHDDLVKKIPSKYKELPAIRNSFDTVSPFSHLESLFLMNEIESSMDMQDMFTQPRRFVIYYLFSDGALIKDEDILYHEYVKYVPDKYLPLRPIDDSAESQLAKNLYPTVLYAFTEIANFGGIIDSPRNHWNVSCIRILHNIKQDKKNKRPGLFIRFISGYDGDDDNNDYYYDDDNDDDNVYYEDRLGGDDNDDDDDDDDDDNDYYDDLDDDNKYNRAKKKKQPITENPLQYSLFNSDDNNLNEDIIISIENVDFLQAKLPISNYFHTEIKHMDSSPLSQGSIGALQYKTIFQTCINEKKSEFNFTNFCIDFDSSTITFHPFQSIVQRLFYFYNHLKIEMDLEFEEGTLVNNTLNIDKSVMDTLSEDSIPSNETYYLSEDIFRVILVGHDYISLSILEHLAMEESGEDSLYFNISELSLTNKFVVKKSEPQFHICPNGDISFCFYIDEPSKDPFYIYNLFKGVGLLLSSICEGYKAINDIYSEESELYLKPVSSNKQKRSNDMKLLRHSGAFLYTLYDCLCYIVTNKNSDGFSFSNEQDFFNNIRKKLALLITAAKHRSQLEPNTDLETLCSKRLSKYPETVMALTKSIVDNTSQIYYGSFGMCEIENQAMDMKKFLYAYIKEIIIKSDPMMFSRIGGNKLAEFVFNNIVKYSVIWQGENGQIPESAERYKITKPSSTSDSDFFKNNITFINELVQLGFIIYYKGSPLERMDQAVFDTNFELIEAKPQKGKKIEWFELNPQIFLNGKEIEIGSCNTDFLIWK